MVEAIISMAILSIVMLSMISILSLFLKSSTNVLQKQQTQSYADYLLANFKSQNSCNNIIKKVFKKLPFEVNKTIFTFKTFTTEGETLDLTKEYAVPKKYNHVKIYEVGLNLDSKPVHQQKVSRGEAVVSFGTHSSDRIYTRRTVVFFELNHLGQIKSCLDNSSYAALEFREKGCKKLNGRIIVSKAGQDCDLSNSLVVKNRTCESMSLKEKRGLCDFP